MTTTSRNADILIRDANGKTLAVVEVKNMQNLSRDEAFATNLAIKRELRKHNCWYIGSFVDGLASIEHAL